MHQPSKERARTWERSGGRSGAAAWESGHEHGGPFYHWGLEPRGLAQVVRVAAHEGPESSPADLSAWLKFATEAFAQQTAISALTAKVGDLERRLQSLEASVAQARTGASEGDAGVSRFAHELVELISRGGELGEIPPIPEDYDPSGLLEE